MVQVKFQITTGPTEKAQVLAECTDLGVTAACFEGILDKYGNSDNFLISLSKSTLILPDPQPEEKKNKKDKVVKAKVNEKKEDIKKEK